MILAISVISCSSSYNKKGRPIATNLFRSEQVTTYTIPGFLIRYAMLATSETRELRPAFKGVSSVSIAVSDPKIHCNSLFSKINFTLNSHNYNTLLEIIDDHSNVTLKVLLEENRVRELVILIEDEKSLVCVSVRGKIDPKNFSYVFDNINNRKRLTDQNLIFSQLL